MSRLVSQRVIETGFSEEECLFVRETMERLRPDFICEWGTNVGHSALMFHNLREELELDCVIHSIDSVDDPPVLRANESALGRGFFVRFTDVYLHVGDGATVGATLAEETKPRRPLFFMDGNHEEDQTLRDLIVVHEACPKAVILIHDATLVANVDASLGIQRFLHHHSSYTADDVRVGQCMVRLWPK